MPPTRTWPRLALRRRFSRSVAFLSICGPVRAMSLKIVSDASASACGLGLQPRQLELGEQQLLDVLHVEPDLVHLLAGLGAGLAGRGLAARRAEHVAGLAVALADALALAAVKDELPALRALDRDPQLLLGPRGDDVLLADALLELLGDLACAAARGDAARRGARRRAGAPSRRRRPSAHRFSRWPT